MALDMGKVIKAAMIPTVILVILEIISKVIGAIPVVNFLICILGIPMLLITLVVMGWAGFKAAKEQGMDVLGGALAGGFAGFVSSVIGGILGFVLNMLGVGVNVATGGDVGGAAIGAGIGVVAVIIGIVVGTVLGLVMGAIGALVAGMKK